MTHTATTAQLAAIGGVTTLSLDYGSREADVLTLAVDLTAADALPWDYRDEVRVTDITGRCIFAGTCDPPQIDPATNRWTITARSSWARLEAVTYAQFDDSGNVVFPSPFTAQYNSALLTRVQDTVEGERVLLYMLPEEAEEYALDHPLAQLSPARCGGLVSAGDIVAATASWAGVAVSSSIGNCVMSLGSSGMASCASLMLGALEQVPNAFTYMDYSASTPTLRIATAPEAALVLDMQSGTISGLGSTGGVTSYTMRRRPDLVPPVVALVCGDECPLVLPEGGDIRTPGAFLAAVAPLRVATSATSGGLNAAGSLTDAMTAAVQEASGQYMRCRAVPQPGSGTAAAVKFWARWFPWLADYASGLQVDAPTITKLSKEAAFPEEDDMQPSGNDAADESAEINNYDVSCSYVLIQGQIPTNKSTGIKFCKGTIEQRVWLANPAAVRPESVRDMGRHFPGNGELNGNERLFVVLTMSPVFVDRRGYVYQTGTGNEPGSSSGGTSTGGGTGEETEEDTTVQTEHAAELAYTALACRDYYAATRQERPELSLQFFMPDFCPLDLLGKSITLQGAVPYHSGIASPVLGVSWDLISGRVSVQCGSGSQSNFNALLSLRRAISAMNARAMSPVANVTAADFSDYAGGGGGGGGGGSATPYNMISPSISPAASAGQNGEEHYPFELFQENGSWYLYRGRVPTPAGMIEFPTTAVQYQQGREYSVLPHYNAATDSWSYKVRYYDPIS